jgi:hypothetical protein
MVPQEHGRENFECAVKSQIKEFKQMDGCTHTQYNRDRHIAQPIAEFLTAHTISAQGAAKDIQIELFQL